MTKTQQHGLYIIHQHTVEIKIYCYITTNNDLCSTQFPKIKKERVSFSFLIGAIQSGKKKLISTITTTKQNS